jgi:hypothetical protein
MSSAATCAEEKLCRSQDTLRGNPAMTLLAKIERLYQKDMTRKKFVSYFKLVNLYLHGLESDDADPIPNPAPDPPEAPMKAVSSEDHSIRLVPRIVCKLLYFASRTSSCFTNAALIRDREEAQNEVHPTARFGPNRRPSARWQRSAEGFEH